MDVETDEHTQLSDAARADGQWLASSDTPLHVARRYSTGGKVVKILEALASGEDGVRVRELARDLGIDKSAISRLFEQLGELGFAERDYVSGPFRAGPAFFTLAARIHSRDKLWTAAEPILRELTNRFNETCYLTVRGQDDVVFRDKIDCSHRVRYIIDPGERAPFHAGAGARSVLIGFTEEELQDYFERTKDLSVITDKTIVDPAELEHQVREDRSRGYSLSMGERVEGGSAIGAPFYGATGACLGALVYTCPVHRFEMRRVPEIADAVIAASNALSERLGAQLG